MSFFLSFLCGAVPALLISGAVCYSHCISLHLYKDICFLMKVSFTCSLESPLLWIRGDPELEYLAELNLLQPEHMWVCVMFSIRSFNLAIF